ncbi:MAG: tryptophan synthase subunit beta [Candidatus Bipolaricaulota bacterium]
MQLSEYPKAGKYGDFGGSYVPEILRPALKDLEKVHEEYRNDPEFNSELESYNRNYGGRPSPLYEAENLTKVAGGARIFLKREDLLHGGAHKFNNVMGQALLAKRSGKERLICETGAGQHGVATSLAGAVLGLDVEVYMGAVDVERQKPNVFRMELLGAEVHEVEAGSKTLKDAINEALRDWSGSVEDTHYLVGSVVGPHPYPMIVRDFQRVIGDEIKSQMKNRGEGLPDHLVACVGGGSNAMGTFYPFADDVEVDLTGVEAGGNEEGNAASLSYGSKGVLHGARTKLLQDDGGQIEETSSISAGLDYPGVGPEHALFQEVGRADYVSVSDEGALDGFQTLTETEGIIPALEPAHAIKAGLRIASEMDSEETLVITLSGRGDKDLETVRKVLK